MKKIIGVVVGVSFLSAMAHTAFADLLNTTTSTIQDTSSTEVKTSDIQTNINTTTGVSPVPAPILVPDTSATPTVSTQPVKPLVAYLALDEGKAVVVGVKKVFVQVNQEAQSVEVFGKSSDEAPEFYLGQAHFDPTRNAWVQSWDSTQNPDGSYRLRAKVETADGRIVYSTSMNVLVGNKDVAVSATATQTPATTLARSEEFKKEYLRKIEEEKQKNLEARQKELAMTLKQSVVQKEGEQPASEQLVLQRTGTASIPARPSKLTPPVDYEKVINEKSQDLKDAIEKGDTAKKAEIISEIVRTAEGGAAATGAPARTNPELTQKVEEGVAKLEQVITDQTRGVVDEKTFKVEKVEVAEVKTKPDGTQTASKIAFRGKALPDSFVTLYIFSIPIVVTVKTDSDGNWNYTLDKELENGNHQVYVGLTDVKGKVVVKSNPLPFVKTASAITVEEALAVPQAQAAPSFVQNNYFYGIVAIIILVVAFVFIFLGIKMSKTTE